MKQQILKYAHPIAALLLMSSLASYFFISPGEQKVVHEEQFQPEKDRLEEILSEIKSFGFAGEPQTKEDSLAVALDLYALGKYVEAKAALKTYLGHYTNDLNARFYLGTTHLYLQEFQDAFRILLPLSEAQDFPMRDDASWYAALAATNTDKLQSTGIFSRLSKDPDSKYQQSATAVMTTILENPGHFSFQIEGGDVLKGSIIVAARTAWWQAGWVRSILAVLFPAGGFGLLYWRKRATQLKLEYQNMSEDKARSEALLYNILPTKAVEDLKKHGHTENRRFENVTVLFCDFVNFTQISETLQPEELVACLNECFEAFDHIVGMYGLEKIKTVGDCYILAGGLASPQSNAPSENACQVVRAAQQMLLFLNGFNERQAAKGSPRFEARVGIHTGAVVAGIVGVKKFAYDIWGDTVNVAARMEQTSEAGKINISGRTYELVRSNFPCMYRGEVAAKGKGTVDMYFVG